MKETVLPSAAPRWRRLSTSDRAALRRVRSDIARESGPEDVAETPDRESRRRLSTWLDAVLGADGYLDDAALEGLLGLERDTVRHSPAGVFVSRVVAVAMPWRDTQVLRAPLEAVVRHHCSRRGYDVERREADHPTSLAWTIRVPTHEGTVDLSLSGDLFELTFPGGCLWIEFAYEPEDERPAVDDLLRVLDVYADPATTTVIVARGRRRPRVELHLSNGTTLWRRGRWFGTR